MSAVTSVITEKSRNFSVEMILLAFVEDQVYRSKSLRLIRGIFTKLIDSTHKSLGIMAFLTSTSFH